MMQNRCLREMKSVSKKFGIAQQIRCEEANLSLGDMQSLSTMESGNSIHTLEEVLQKFEVG